MTVGKLPFAVHRSIARTLPELKSGPWPKCNDTVLKIKSLFKRKETITVDLAIMLFSLLGCKQYNDLRTEINQNDLFPSHAAVYNLNEFKKKDGKHVI